MDNITNNLADNNLFSEAQHGLDQGFPAIQLELIKAMDN